MDYGEDKKYIIKGQKLNDMNEWDLMISDRM